VGELVGYQGAAARRVRLVLIVGENDVVARGVSIRLNGTRRGSRLLAGVNADVAEVLAEAGLEKGAGGGVERMSGRTEDVAHHAWEVRGGRWPGGAALDSWPRLFLLALCAHFAIVGAGTWGRRREVGVGMHYGVGKLVGLAFFGVGGVADGEFGLNETEAQQLLYGLIAHSLLQLPHGAICLGRG
jgi:hypothetical protein